MMGFCTRFSTEPIALKALLDEGKLGSIYYCKTGVHRRRGTPAGWFTDSSKSGGGALIDIGVHMLDLAWYMMGRPEPERISGSIYNIFGNSTTKSNDRWESMGSRCDVFNVEDLASGIIHFKNGATLIIDASWARNGAEGEFLELFGDKAGASLSPIVVYHEEAGYLVDSHPKLKDENSF